MEEIWKDIKGYEGLYQISNYGNIKRFYKNTQKRSVLFKILKPQQTTKYGHLNIRLYKNNKWEIFYVHRLVLEIFVGPCPFGMECRHLDGNPRNNRLENLCWGTRIENMRDSIKHGTRYKPNVRGSKHHRSKLKEEEIKKIKKLLKENKLKMREIAKLFNVSIGCISGIKYGQSWKHIK